mmetsp:Transcript_36734/g.90416  ORF Transcript_36734/g.90416 Transcript_36734/m.90416 type:complete len:212 (-) Transcript_36734:870-1505(-)
MGAGPTGILSAASSNSTAPSSKLCPPPSAESPREGRHYLGEKEARHASHSACPTLGLFPWQSSWSEWLSPSIEWLSQSSTLDDGGEHSSGVLLLVAAHAPAAHVLRAAESGCWLSVYAVRSAPRKRTGRRRGRVARSQPRCACTALPMSPPSCWGRECRRANSRSPGPSSISASTATSSMGTSVSYTSLTPALAAPCTAWARTKSLACPWK